MRNLVHFMIGLLFVWLFSWQVNGYSIRSEATYTTTALDDVTIHTPSQRIFHSAEFNISFMLRGHDRPLKFALIPNHDLLVQDPHIRFLDSAGRSTRAETLKRESHRVYRGDVFRQDVMQWERVGWARINVIRDGLDPLFDGAFSIAGLQYHINIASSAMTVSYNAADTDHSLPTNVSTPEHYLAPQKRQFGFDSDTLIDTIGDSSGCPNTRQIALVGIATDCSYTGSFDSSEDLVDALVTMVNTASEVFESTFNIALALHNLTIEEEGCPQSPSDDLPWNAGCSAGDLNWRLQAFSQWRTTFRDDDNAYWTLMSGCPGTSEVGVSWVGELCNQDTGTNVVARANNQWQIFACVPCSMFLPYDESPS
ncbi:zinc metallopeptidase Mde10 [Aspergillus californicus]